MTQIVYWSAEGPKAQPLKITEVSVQGRESSGLCRSHWARATDREAHRYFSCCAQVKSGGALVRVCSSISPFIPVSPYVFTYWQFLSKILVPYCLLHPSNCKLLRKNCLYKTILSAQLLVTVSSELWLLSERSSTVHFNAESNRLI